MNLRRTLALLTAAASALALSACGSSSDSSAAGGGGDKPTIRIAYQQFPSGDLIVRQNKWLEEALPGYDITWTAFDSGASINTAFVAGSIDIAAIGSSPVARGLSAPLNIPYQVAFVLDVAGDNEALVARKEAGISSVADLKGKKIATSFASTAHYSLLVALDKAGIAETDVNLIDLEPQDILAAWTRGDIDAAYTWLPTLDELRKTGDTLITSRELAEGGNPTLDLGVVSTAFITAHPDAVDAWRKAEARALTLIEKDPTAAATAIGTQLNITPDAAAAQLKQGVYLTPANLSSAQWLGTPEAPGKLADNLLDAATFLKNQQKIDAVPDLATVQKAIYNQGLADVVAG